MLTVLAFALLSATRISAAIHKFQPPIKNLVTFGDSYTDAVSTGDRAVAWPIYAGGYGNFSVHDFARSGGTCSNLITPRPFPSVFESQLPAFEQSVKNGSLVLNPRTTLFTIWIGTNDVGAGALLTGNQAPDVSIVNVTSCAVNWVSTLYAQGFRNFLFQNMIPLNLTVLYSSNSYPNIFWDIERNTTEWSVFMSELVSAGNELASLKLAALAPTLPGAHIGLFSSFGLINDMYHNPSLYLNGTDPLNVTFPSQACILSLGGTTNNCTKITGAAADSYLWVDELHPGEQANRIIAREIVKVINGTSDRWTTWFS